MNSLLVLQWLMREVAGQSDRARPRRHVPPSARHHDRQASSRGVIQQSGALDRIEDTAVVVAPAPRRPGLEIRCFGRFEVTRQGIRVDDWRRGKARTLLKFLVDRRYPVSRDVLIELLWPNTDAQPATNSLRVALHALRQALGPHFVGTDVEQEYIVVANGNYQLHPEAPLWVDVDEFVGHFERGVRFERQGRLAEAMGAYEDAEVLYRDDYLVEDMYEDWAVARRERLKDQYLLIVTELADYCFDRGDAVGCILRCHKIIHKDPCREDAYARLMRCYAKLGQRSQALHWYDICARTLRRELDVPPLESTSSLYRQIAARSGRAAERAANGSELP